MKKDTMLVWDNAVVQRRSCRHLVYDVPTVFVFVDNLLFGEPGIFCLGDPLGGLILLSGKSCWGTTFVWIPLLTLSPTLVF